MIPFLDSVEAFQRPLCKQVEYGQGHGLDAFGHGLVGLRLFPRQIEVDAV
jgi:hypothetical protein